jgi:hypothetical protein
MGAMAWFGLGKHLIGAAVDGLLADPGSGVHPQLLGSLLTSVDVAPRDALRVAAFIFNVCWALC